MVAESADFVLVSIAGIFHASPRSPSVRCVSKKFLMFETRHGFPPHTCDEECGCFGETGQDYGRNARPIRPQQAESPPTRVILECDETLIRCCWSGRRTKPNERENQSSY